MDTSILKKRLNTYKTGKGRLNKVDDEVVMELLRAWENWQGRTSDLYKELGLSKMQLVTMIQKAKLLVKKGASVGSEFKEIKVESGVSGASDKIELNWSDGRVIRFSKVEQLLEFLNRTASNDSI